MKKFVKVEEAYLNQIVKDRFMRGKAIIVEKNQTFFIVESIPKIDCGSCGSRKEGRCSNPQGIHRKIKIDASRLNGNIGDIVEYQVPLWRYLGFIAQVFGLPLSGMCIGFAIGYGIISPQDPNAELKIAGLLFVGLLVALGVLWGIKHAGKGNNVPIQILRCYSLRRK